MRAPRDFAISGCRSDLKPRAALAGSLALGYDRPPPRGFHLAATPNRLLSLSPRRGRSDCLTVAVIGFARWRQRFTYSTKSGVIAAALQDASA